MNSGEQVDSSWWKGGEPDSSGECVSAGEEGLQDDVCDKNDGQALAIVRKPLCMLGKSYIAKLSTIMY